MNAVPQSDVGDAPPGLLAPRRRGRVVYLCEWTGTSGGIQVLYDHVRLLRRAGVDAMLGAVGTFRRCDWFVNDPATTPAVDDCLAALTPDDVLVLPEICIGAPQLDGVAARRVAFVQNPSLLRGRLDAAMRVMIPARTLVPWVVDVARHTGDVVVVRGFLPAELVHPPRTFAGGRPRVLLVDRPDKHRGEPARIHAALAHRDDVVVTFVDRAMPRAAFTELFRSHDVYVHASHPEGFPISVLEAFGAGCLVVGFSGGGGLEFMRNGDNCVVVPDGDAEAAVTALRRVLTSPRAAIDALLRSARATALALDESGTAAALARAFGGAGMRRR